VSGSGGIRSILKVLYYSSSNELPVVFTVVGL